MQSMLFAWVFHTAKKKNPKHLKEENTMLNPQISAGWLSAADIAKSTFFCCFFLNGQFQIDSVPFTHPLGQSQS